MSLVLMLLLFSAVVGYSAVRRFDHQVDQLLRDQSQALWRDYQMHRQDQSRLLANISQQLQFLTRQQGPITLDGLGAALASHWPDFALLGGLQGASLFDEQGVPRYRRGELARDNLQDIDGPAGKVRCQPDCLLDLGFDMAGTGAVLVLTLNLGDSLLRLAEKHNLELAVLGPPGTAEGGYWQRPLLMLSHRSRTLSVLSAAVAQDKGLQQLIQTPRQALGDGQSWAFFHWPLATSGESLLLFRDMAPLEQNKRDFIQELLTLLLVTLMLASGLGGMLFWRMLWRLRVLRRSLPMLAQGRYADMRHRLDSKPMVFKDELTELEQVSVELSTQLEQLEGDVDRYTNELQRLVMMDALTGLPNRAMFKHELAKALASLGRTDDQIAVLFLDLDEFKRVNDTLGHDVGDELLKTVANRLKKSIRSMDTVCRLGGDEFTLIVRGLESEGDIHRIIHQIFASLQQPVQLGRHTLIVTTSIGVVFCDNPMMRPDELLKRADLAMYQAKQAGRSNYRVFNEQMLESASLRLMLEQDIRTALAERQMYLAFQPIVGLESRRLEGFEMLLRWHHPSRGLVMPSEYLGEVEGRQEAIDLAQYVLALAVQHLAKLDHEYGEQAFYLSVNLSPCQYLDPDLVPFVRSLLERHGVAPRRLVLELTEESLIKHLDKALAIMQQLKAMGLRIAIDDFGTGYSSLSYLKQLPFDLLKVDRGFVADLDHSDVDRNIVSNVIELAHNLDRQVVAEGVENHDQSQFLREVGCDAAQGYLISAPLDESHALKLLSQLGPGMIWHDDDHGVQSMGRQGRG